MAIGVAGLIGISAGAQLFSSIFAGNARRDATGRLIDEERRRGQQAFQASLPSFGEMSAIQAMVDNRMRVLAQSQDQIQRQRDLLDAVDPTLQEAATQALSLLQGEESRVLAPIRAERERQRTQLENQLAERLGPGFRTSSAGLEALGRFDDQSFSLLSTAQQNALGTLLQTTVAARPDLTRDIATFGQVLGGLSEQELAAGGRIRERQISAINQTAISPGLQAAQIQQAGQTAETVGSVIGDVAGGLTTLQLFNQFGGRNPAAGQTPAPGQNATVGNVLGR